MSVSTLLYLCCQGGAFSEHLTVLDTTSDLSVFSPWGLGTGAELDKSSTLGHKEVTVCARFLNHQFTTFLDDEPKQFIFTWASTELHLGIVSSWEDFGITGKLFLKSTWIIFKEIKWELNVWNHICVMLDSVTNILRIIMNGETAFYRTDLEFDVSLLDANLFN